MKPVRMGIIGLGRWGLNYFRTFNELRECSVEYICATRKSKLTEAVGKIGPKIKPKQSIDYDDILNDGNIDAVAIATNGSSHYMLAKAALEAGKHVLVEKPVAFSSKDVKKLIETSKKNGKVLMAGHQHLFNPGIQKLKSDIDKGLFGKISFIHMEHFGNGPVRDDMGAIWDFFPHSASIFLHFFGKLPISVGVSGQSYIKKGIEDIAVMNAQFSGKIFGVSVGSWLFPLKKMQITLVGSKMKAFFDDYAEDKLHYFDASGKALVKLDSSRPLTNQLAHFIDCIQNKRKSLTDGKHAFEVTKILEAAQKSLNSKGKRVQIKG